MPIENFKNEVRPYSKSPEVLRALSKVRGSESGFFCKIITD